MEQAATAKTSNPFSIPELALTGSLGQRILESYPANSSWGSEQRGQDRQDIQEAIKELQTYLKTNGYGNQLAQWNVFEAVWGGSQGGSYVIQKDEFSGELYRLGYGDRPVTVGNLINLIEDLIQVPLSGLNGSYLERRLEAFLEKRTFNPVQRYLNGLPINRDEAWKGWDTLACDIFGLEDDLSQTLLSHWILGALQRALDPGCIWRQALILQGVQEAGKTQFLKSLFGERFYVSRDSEMSDEHVKRILTNAWIVELEELEAIIDKRSVANLKRWISIQEDDYKVNHKEQTKRIARRCVIAGTVNSTEFLRDDTGHSRFWIIPGIQAVDLGYVRANRDRIWGEAYRRYLLGERGYDQAITKDAETRAKDFETANPWSDPLQDLLSEISKPSKDGETVQIVTRTADLLTGLGISPREHRRHSKLLASALGTLGYEQRKTRIEGKQARYWFGPEADTQRLYYVDPEGRPNRKPLAA